MKIKKSNLKGQKDKYFNFLRTVINMDYEVGICDNCGGKLVYIHCLDEVICEEHCEDEEY